VAPSAYGEMICKQDTDDGIVKYKARTLFPVTKSCVFYFIWFAARYTRNKKSPFRGFFIRRLLMLFLSVLHKFNCCYDKDTKKTAQKDGLFGSKTILTF
jgi:hypothetical protein